MNEDLTKIWVERVLAKSSLDADFLLGIHFPVTSWAPLKIRLRKSKPLC